MDKVIKRDKKQESFNEEKIKIAIRKANGDVPKKHRLTEEEISNISSGIKTLEKKSMTVDAINDIIINTLVAMNKPEVVNKFIEYRYIHKLRHQANTTDDSIAEMLGGTSDYWTKENSNKNAKVVTTQRDYIAGISSTDISRRILLPEEIVKAHDAGILHFHDMDYFAQNALHNCDLIAMFDMLHNGTCVNGFYIAPQKRLITATTVATQLITAVNSSQYGGASINLSDLAPFVGLSRKDWNAKFSKFKLLNIWPFNKLKKAMVNFFLKDEIKSAVQTFNYQLNSMSTTNGQSPFITVFMYLNQRPECKDDHALLIKEFLKQRIKGMQAPDGTWVTPAFPKLIYVLQEDNIKEGSKYYDLTKLAVKCSVKRLVPDYISEKVMKSLKHSSYGTDDCYSVMGCRSALTPDRFSETLGNISNALDYEPGKPKYSGRFNMGVVSINLPDIALSSKGNKEEFWKIFEERAELCHRALQCRINRLKGRTSDMAPILWQHGALARLAPGEKIDKLLYNGYATISLGYIGVYECTKYMTGHSHTDGAEGEAFALEVMKFMNDKCNQWKAEENIDYSIYGTPAESMTYKFAKCLKNRFGEDVFEKIDGKDRNYMTNSYHVPVFEEIDAFNKLRIESKFQALSPGGAISYVETPDLQKNPEAAMKIVQFIYDNIMYAELNTKSDYCMKCGFEGEIELVELEGKKYKWHCPNCGNEDFNFMKVARRTCGYVGLYDYNDGRKGDIHDRVLHIDNFECKECN